MKNQPPPWPFSDRRMPAFRRPAKVRLSTTGCLLSSLAAGATLDRPVQEKKWGLLANLADPFGNGLCLLEMRGRGYDELLAGDPLRPD